MGPIQKGLSSIILISMFSITVQANWLTRCMGALKPKPENSLQVDFLENRPEIEQYFIIRPRGGFQFFPAQSNLRVPGENVELNELSYRLDFFPGRSKTDDSHFAITMQTLLKQDDPKFDLRNSLYSHSIQWKTRKKNFAPENLSRDQIRALFELIYEGNPLERLQPIYEKAATVPHESDIYPIDIARDNLGILSDKITTDYLVEYFSSLKTEEMDKD